MSGKGALIFCCVLLGVVAEVSHVFADLLDIPGVKGPQTLASRTKRSHPNYYDCPPSWNPQRPEPPAPLPCQPGYRLVPDNEGVPHGVPPPLCPPWVDRKGRCHVTGQRFDENECRQRYGEALYNLWRSNAHLTRFVDPPGPPSLPACVPV